MNDLIKRQDAIDAINQYGSVWMEYTEVMTVDEIAERALKASKKSMVKILRDLPSAQKKGEWIEDGYKDYPCVCSECGTRQDIKAKFLFSYCPNCGADMRKGVK